MTAPTPPSPGTGRGEPASVPKVARSVLQGLFRLEAGFAILAFALITLALAADLAGREFFNMGLFGAQRFAVYCMIVVAMLGFSLAVSWRAHLGIEVADKLAPAAWHETMERLADITAAAICLFLAYWAWRFVAGSFADQARGQGLEVLLWPIQSVLVWCFASAALRHLAFATWPGLRPARA
jgi:TRAP-type C4-dicarboxylate transport system permease small subunit